MKYGSVCSGIEAASVAWHDLGWEPQWFSEIEQFPSEVLKHRFPDVPNLGDMTQLTQNPTFNERSIDLLVGGTPCQSFSVAGLRKGLKLQAKELGGKYFTAKEQGDSKGMNEALEAILKSCDNNSGGIYGIWINQQDEIASITPTSTTSGTSVTTYQRLNSVYSIPSTALSAKVYLALTKSR